MSLRPIAQSLSPIADKALGKQGLALGGLLEHWAEIAGDLSERCRPVRIAFPRGRRDGATLHLRAPSAFALMLQHAVPLLKERVNGFCGYAAIAEVRIQHGDVARPARRWRSSDLKPLGAEDEARIVTMAALVEDGELKAALADLGRTLAGR